MYDILCYDTISYYKDEFNGALSAWKSASTIGGSASKTGLREFEDCYYYCYYRYCFYYYYYYYYHYYY